MENECREISPSVLHFMNESGFNAETLGEEEFKSKVSEFEKFESFLIGADSLEAASVPLIKYLSANFHPHVTAITTSTGCEVLEGIKSTGGITRFVTD